MLASIHAAKLDITQSVSGYDASSQDTLASQVTKMAVSKPLNEIDIDSHLYGVSAIFKDTDLKWGYCDGK